MMLPSSTCVPNYFRAKGQIGLSEDQPIYASMYLPSSDVLRDGLLAPTGRTYLDGFSRHDVPELLRQADAAARRDDYTPGKTLANAKQGWGRPILPMEPPNLTPYVQSGRDGFYVYRSDMSLAPANQPAAPITAVTIFVLHPGAGPDFIAAIKKVDDALRKQADWPKTGGCLELVNGGERPTFVLLNSRKNWADFAPLPKTVADVLNDTYGKETDDRIQKTIRDCTAHQYTEAAAYRRRPHFS